MPDHALDLDALDFTKERGLVTVVAQDAESCEVLMVARADRAALERTLATGEMHYHSRTRGAWHKGATSGNVQRVVSLATDCDGDSVLARVVPVGPACHTGARTCFGDPGNGEARDPLDAPDVGGVLDVLDATIGARALDAAPDPQVSYTQRLLADRNLRLKKLGEETVEFVTACADGDRTRATEEAADLVYHLLVALRAVGGSLADLRAELARRTSA